MSQIGIIQLTSFNSNEVNLLTDAIYSLSRNCKIIRSIGETLSFIYYSSTVDFDIEKFVRSKADLLGYLAKGKEISMLRVLILNETGIEDDCQTEYWSFKKSAMGTLDYSSMILDFNLYTFVKKNMDRIMDLYEGLDRVPNSGRLLDKTNELEVFSDVGEYLHYKRFEGTELSFINPLYTLNRVLELGFLLLTDILDVMIDDISKLISV